MSDVIKELERLAEEYVESRSILIDSAREIARLRSKLNDAWEAEEVARNDTKESVQAQMASLRSSEAAHKHLASVAQEAVARLASENASLKEQMAYATNWIKESKTWG